MSDAVTGGKAAGKRSGKSAGPVDREPDFEESLRRLEAIVGRLEAGELPLEETLRLFEEGQTLVRNCGSLLERAEQRVKELVEGAGETRDMTLSGAGGGKTAGEAGANAAGDAPQGPSAGSASAGRITDREERDA
jgi:exodeoxyribonuclease VII small subunit